MINNIKNQLSFYYKPQLVVPLLIAIVLWTLGILIIVGICKEKDIYAKGVCTITNMTINAKCFANTCEYSGNITIQYNGTAYVLSTNMQIFDKIDTKSEAESLMDKKYTMNENITCYYPIKSNKPILLNPLPIVPKIFGYAMSIMALILAISYTFLLICECHELNKTLPTSLASAHYDLASSSAA